MNAAIAVNPLLSQRFASLFPQESAGSSVSGEARSLPQAAPRFLQASEHAGFAPSERGRMSVARMQQFEQSLQYSETTSLQLTTQEGDRVTVDFRQLYAQYQSYKEAQAGDAGPQGVRYFESREAMETTAFEERFGLAVEGDLNEDELAAIIDVFEQVDSLANTFYGGDLEGALQQAMNLNLDADQLKGMKLNMTQSASVMTRYQQSAMSEYQTVQQAPSQSAASMTELPDYLQNWQESLERIDALFEQARRFVDELMGVSLAQRDAVEEERTPDTEGWKAKVEAFHDHLEAFMNPAKPAESELDRQAEAA